MVNFANCTYTYALRYDLRSLPMMLCPFTGTEAYLQKREGALWYVLTGIPDSNPTRSSLLPPLLRRLHDTQDRGRRVKRDSMYSLLQYK